MIDIATYFKECVNDKKRIRVWLDNELDEAMSLCVKEVFIDNKGALVGLGLGLNFNDDAWEFYKWEDMPKWASIEEEECTDVDEDEWLDKP